jgi:hypothetical protein
MVKMAFSLEEAPCGSTGLLQRSVVSATADGKQTLHLFFLDTLMRFVYIPLPDEIAHGHALLSHTKSLCRCGRA